MKKYLLIVVFASIPLFGYLFWHFSTPDTLTTNLSPYQKAGDEVKNSFSSLPTLPIQEEDERYTIEDTTREGIQITYANQPKEGDNTALAAEPKEETKPGLTLRFPKQYAKEPIEVQIAEGKSILIQDKTAKGDYTAQSLSLGGETPPLLSKEGAGGGLKNASSWLQSLLGGSTSKWEEERAYLSYTDATKRITTYYAYGHDQATGEKQLKNWQVYDHPAIVKGESVAYSFTNAKLRKNDNGTISVYYYGDQELQNDKASAEVDPSLMARAQRTLAKDMGDSIDSGETPANFVIPKPYYINANGDTINLDWRLSMDGKDISIDFTPEASEYPLALDPTLSFTAPGQSNTGDVITGEAGSGFGTATMTGDFNSDGRLDLAVGAPNYSTNTGRAYIFYGDGGVATNATNADVIITGEATNNYFGSLAAGDFNSDGKQDFAVGAYGYSTNTGRVYIFYNDGSIPRTAATADVIITGEATSNEFGASLTNGDFNSDGRQDLVVGARSYSSSTGRAYIFYNDGSIPTTAATADITIDGAGGSFGVAVVAGDLDSDGTTDLVVGAHQYSSSSGRAYVFYNDGSMPTTAATADVQITTGSTFDHLGHALAVGDFNADGRVDLAVAKPRASGGAARGYVQIHYNDGSLASGADITISGEANGYYFGSSLVAGDFNADGRTDLAVGAPSYSASGIIGRAYIFYNDGSIPTTAGTADVIITGEATDNLFGSSLAAGDLNSDGKTDLAVGAYSRNRAYIFYSQNGQVNTNQNITGETTSNYFGQAMTTGDFNADGRIDLAVGAYGYSTNTGRVYIFYGDGQIPNTAATADLIITGEATNNYFGSAMTAGDLNTDGKTDLIIGAYGYSTNTGRTYIFYNDGSIPTTAATADVVITGQGTNNYSGYALTVGDFNADSKTDIAVGAWGYSTDFGRTYILYADGTNDFGTASCTGSSPTVCLAANADVIITGTSASYFGDSLAAGDLNADGRIDLIVGADNFNIYIFYNDGSIPTTIATADVTIGSFVTSGLGYPIVTGDFNTDGRTDLAVGSPATSSAAGKTYIFYNDGSLPTTTATADVTISGEAADSNFGKTLSAGDFNADGRTDLAVGAYSYSSNAYTGRAYIFYNDGSIPTTAARADVIITGETTGNYFSRILAAGDFNNDGRADLVVGAYGYSTNTGRVYFYETRENFAWKLQSVSPLTGGLRTGLSGTGQELKITGNSAGDSLGNAMTTGDFNSDGKVDLAVGASGYSSSTGRVYLFYNDGALSSGASGADVVITGGATSNSFGSAIVSGDFNADGKADLAVTALGYSTNTGRAYIFYNDGSYPTTATTADVIITGETTSNAFGSAVTAGDFNADGRTDLAVGAYLYSSNTGRTYVFYNDGSIPTTAATADVAITGEANTWFGVSLATGDFNADGKTDLAVGGTRYTSYTGRTYIFYVDGTNDFGTASCTGSSPTVCLAGNADTIITGFGAGVYFSSALTVGDFNSDGKTDLAVGGYGMNSNQGRAYIYYNNGGIPVSADVSISGTSSGNYFGSSLTSGDFNADGRTDLVVGAYGYSSNTGGAYVFYNDGSIPTTAATADVILTGEATNNYYGYALAAGDLNADGKTDLVVGAYGYASSKGRAYIYTFNDPVITGETTNNSFGTSIVSGDFNADGKIDLAVGAPGYSTNTGRVYLFYQDGTIPATAASADVIITGEATSNFFGYTMTVGDLNADGKTDLAVGAYGYSSTTGRAYIFYNDGSIPTTAATADVTITGESGAFGVALVSGDLNADGKIDLAIGAYQYGSSAGRAYIFYNDGSIPTTGATADVIFSDGSTFDHFGNSLAVGDFNSDGRVDLAVGAPRATGGGFVGFVGIYYNDGSYSSTPDVTLTGEGANNAFGYSLSSGDFNADGRTDLAVGAYMYSTSTGRAYIFYNDGSIPTTAATADVTITGEATNNSFGVSLVSGDFNADGRTDLVVGASGYTTNTGRAYIFYNDGSIPTTAGTADVIITGEATSNYFGYTMTVGDLNTDGKTDLAVGAYGYSTSTGRIYLFTSEAKADSAPPATARVRGVGKLRGTSKLR